MNARINREELCKDRFADFLCGLYPASAICWQKVHQSSEPPDYYVFLDGARYAVEVTTLMEKVAGSQLPFATVVASFEGFVEDIERAAREEGCLSGAYVVGFLRPIDDFRSVREQLREDLLCYIRDTQAASSAPEQVILRRPGLMRCSIWKNDRLSDRVMVGGPTRGKWKGEAAVEICALLEERLNNKCYKLRNIPDPKILLLYDAYKFAAPVMFIDCLSNMSATICFHTVFVAQSDRRDDFVLYSEDENWRHSS